MIIGQGDHIYLKVFKKFYGFRICFKVWSNFFYFIWRKKEENKEYSKRVFNDLQTSSKIIKKNTGKSPRTMVWPYGRYNEEVWLLAQKAGFNEIIVGHRHGFGISNTIKWLNERKPGGLNKLEFITPEIDFAWVKMLENTGMAELLHFELVKS